MQSIIAIWQSSFTYFLSPAISDRFQMLISIFFSIFSSTIGITCLSAPIFISLLCSSQEFLYFIYIISSTYQACSSSRLSSTFSFHSIALIQLVESPQPYFIYFFKEQLSSCFASEVMLQVSLSKKDNSDGWYLLR